MNSVFPKSEAKEWGLESKMIYQAVLVRALDVLSEEEEVEFDLLLDEDTTTPQKVLTFLRSKIPEFEQIVLEERQNIKQNLLVPMT